MTVEDEQRIQALLGAIYDRWKLHPDLSLGLILDELIFTLGIQTETKDEEALARILAFTGGLQR